MTQPLVSVVMSVHNDRPFVRAAVESVVAQEGIDFEVVAVDDGSTDGSADILDGLARQDRRLRVLHQENAGLTSALIRGCSEARGELIARQDADDLSLPGRMERQAERLRGDADLALVSCWARAIGPGDEALWESVFPDRPEEARDLVLRGVRGPACHGSTMFRRADYEAVGGYRRQFWFAQDSDLWMRLCERGKLGLVEEILYAYRISEASISAVSRPIQRELGRIAHRCRRARAEGSDEAAWLEEAARLRPPWPGSARHAVPGAGAYLIGRALLRRGDARAWGYLRRAAWANPRNWRAFASLGQLLMLRAIERARYRRGSRLS